MILMLCSMSCTCLVTVSTAICMDSNLTGVQISIGFVNTPNGGDHFVFIIEAR
jgi:hypothetical protein